MFRLVGKGYGRYKLQIATLVTLGFLSGFLEGIGINALIPLFSRLTGEGKAEDSMSRMIEALFTNLNVGFGLKTLIIFITIAFILKAIVIITARYITFRIAADYEQQVRSKVFIETMKAEWPFLLHQKIGFLETLLMRDVYMSGRLLESLSVGIISFTSLAIYVLIVFNISPIITLLSLGIGGMVFLILKPLLWEVKQLSKSVVNINKEIAHHVNENIVGLKVVKSGYVQDEVSRKANRYFEMLRSTQLRVSLFSDIPNVLTEPTSVIFIMGIFSFSYVSTDFQFPVFAATMYFIHRIFSRIQSVQSVAYRVNEIIPYLQSLIDFKDEVFLHREHHLGTRQFKFHDNLEFRDVNFSYNSDRQILAHTNFRVKSGEMVGLVGKSGAGKTTVVDLILRLLETLEGRILVDGIDISEIDIREWRKNIGYVSQEIFVLNDTIENNIKFYDETISQEDLATASRMAHIYDFVQRQQDKFQTQVGERGVLLSGGEKQRLVLARALVRNPKLLVLDEATSALDNESEFMIQKTIEDLKGKTTVFVIAHRISTLFNCDKILVLEDGKIKEEGTPKVLLKDKSSYFYKSYNIRGDKI